ncbi:MAG: XRE family transcriptional regulator [Chloroflexota bacterium]
MREPIAVAPDVLVWARQSALASRAEAAERTGQSEDTIGAWEAGDTRPTYGQLERLADEYGVSVNVLLLPNRPSIPQPPPDFRAPKGQHERLSRVARRELRRSRQLQGLLSEVSVLPPPALPAMPPGADQAGAVRAALGVSLAEQRSWKNGDQAFRAWRNALARLGVLVLQYRLPDGELQGFSLPASNGGPPVVFVNQGDWINARIFTLMHELGHLILAQDGGICDPWRFGPRASNGSLEARCNRLAGAVLVPGDDFRQQHEVLEVAQEADDAHAIWLLGILGSRYRVSSQVIWYRVHDLGLVSDDRFWALWPKLRSPVRKKRPPAEDEERKGIPRWKMAGSRYGVELIEGLLGAVSRGALEPARVMRTLNLGTGDLARLAGDAGLE